MRVHRGHLVNVDRIREIQPWDHGDHRILLQDGSCLNLSRRYRNRLEHLFRYRRSPSGRRSSRSSAARISEVANRSDAG